MKNAALLIMLLGITGITAASVAPLKAGSPKRPAPAPLFRDPLYDGAADPTLIWNQGEKCWWMLYTQRRANVDGDPGVKWCHGTDIGLASTPDQGATWLYRGVAKGLEFEVGRNTFWAPEVVFHEGRYHAYISYVRGVNETWAGTRDIVHYTSTNLVDWKFEAAIIPGAIDACVHRLPDGHWRMWFKNEQHKYPTTAADSDDLYRWQPCAFEMADPDPGKGEGPDVVYWHGWYWLVKDLWKGLGVYRSADANRWEFKNIILDKPGKRAGDFKMGQHPGLLLQDAHTAFIFYFVHQGEREPDSRHTWLQAAKLEFDGDTLRCDRNAEFNFVLQPPISEFTSEHPPVLALGSANNRDQDSVLLFSFFRDNGQDGLFLASSEDGLKWTELKPPGKSFLTPRVGGKLMRDPNLALGPDGIFHMVWTSGWGKPPVLGYAHSRDLAHWSDQQAVAVMSQEPTTENVWAPELFYDAAKTQWLIFWSSTIPGRFPETEHSGDHNHRIYYTVTKDFATFAPSKLFLDGGFNVIDATMLKTPDQCLLIVKDETRQPPKKNLRIASASGPEGPWSAASAPISTNTWVEGPSPVQVGSQYYLYFDHYTAPQYYGALRTSDLKLWDDISPQVTLPKGARHGTALRVPRRIVQQLNPVK